MNEYQFEEQEFQIDIKDYWRVILKRKYLIIGIILTVMSITIIRTLTMPRLYTSEAQIQIESDRIRIVEDITTQSRVTRDEFYNTQLKLLLSKSLFRDVAERLSESDLIQLGYEPGTFAEKTGVEKVKIVAGKLSDDCCSISPVRDTQLVNIQYTVLNPELAAKLANFHAEEFIEGNIRKKYETTAAASAFITDQIQTLQQQIQIDEQTLQKYIKQQEIIKAPNQETITLSNLQKLNNALMDAVTERIAKESRYQMVINAQPDTLDEVQNDSLIQRLKAEFSELDNQYELMSQRFQPDWPELQRIKADMEQTSKRMDTEIRKVASRVITTAHLEYENATSKELEFRKRLEEQRNRAQDQEDLFTKYNSLRMKIDNKKKIMAELLMKESETEVSARLKGLKTSNIWTVETAEPYLSPSSPRPKRNLLIGLMIGFVISIGFAFFLEYLDNTVKSADEVERYLNLPFLGFIPSLTQGNIIHSARLLNGGSNGNNNASVPVSISNTLDFISFSKPKSVISESYKTIRTSILLSSDTFNVCKILVTSSQPKEGKSTTAINLAITLTQLDKKVVIIDADMRNPRIHKSFNLDNTSGLSDFLKDTLDPSQLIKRCEIPNLGVITSGHRPTNPSELLSSKKMVELLDKLSSNFDHVVIDSPPILAVTDALIISKMVDSTVIIVHGGVTSREAVVAARDRMHAINAHIQGVVINNVDTSKNSYYYYYYPYKYGKYGYGYTYGFENDGEEEVVEPEVKLLVRNNKSQKK